MKIETTTPSLLIVFVLGCSALLPAKTFGVVPAPDGFYPGGNTAEGQNALLSLTSGTFNTAVGWLSLRSNTAGESNTAIGAGTLLGNTTGGRNTATGAGALLSNSSGTANTANGAYALLSNTEGGYNTAIGDRALLTHTTGDNNTAIGASALFSDTTGAHNTATGAAALFSNTEGNSNTAIGDTALALNTTGNSNTAIGQGALFSNTTGGGNTAIGYLALVNNNTGGANTALGFGAGNGVTTAHNVICIGTVGVNVENSCFIGNIRNVQTANANAIPVLIDSAGQLGTASSSRRYKKEIKPMDKASETILALKPVTFRYKSDPAAAGPQFGLIAEEVAEVNPDLVVRDENGDIYTVRYEAVNAMLLNEFLKEHRKVEQQYATIADLKLTVAQQRRDFEAAIAQERKQSEATAAQQQKEIHVLIGSLKEQAVQIRKVSDQLQLNKPAPQMVLNNP